MPTPKELFSELRDVIRALEWTPGGNKIFGNNCFVATEFPIQQISTFRSPSCFITDEGSAAISNHNQLQEQAFNLSFFVDNFGERHGENVMLGGNGVANSSPGAGIFDVEQQLLNAIRTTTQLDSAQITLINRSRVKTKYAKANEPNAIRTLAFSALVTIDDGSGGGDPSVLDVLRSPGFLYWDPPDISAQSFGTKLGFLANGLAVDPRYFIEYIGDEGAGMTPTTSMFQGNVITAVADFWSYTAEVLELAFPGMTTGKQVRIPGSVKTGDAVTTGQLLFVPINLVDQYIVVLNSCVPQIITPFALNNTDNTTFRVQFTCLDSAAQLYMGPINDF